MIRKLRRKFILVIMGIVTLLMLTAFLCVLLTTQNNLDHSSQSTLQDALFQNGGGPGPNRDDRGPRMPPTLTVSYTDGTVHILKNQIMNMDDSEAATVAGLAIQTGKTSGILKDYDLRFLVQTDPRGQMTIAFADNSMEKNIIETLLLNSGMIGAGTLLLFFFVSIILSRWILRPVEDAWERQRQFVADASHELKTPLTVVLSNVSMLMDEQVPSRQKDMDRLERIQEEAKRMKQLVEDMLNLARSDAGSAKTQFTEVSLSFITESSALLFEPRFFEAGERFDYQVEEGLSVMGSGDRLRQLVDIFLDNACKYTVKGGLIQLSLCRSSASEACLEVSNEGEPIPQEELAHIFQRFYRIDKSRTEGGFGLGLAIAECIVLEHGGKIWAKSGEGNSNIFSVSLPLADVKR